MKYFLLFFISIYSFFLSAQDRRNEYKTIQLIQQRNIYLNGGARASFGGKSRIYLKIDLPPGTVYWFYSFTTSPGESGIKNLNLLAQISTFIIDPSGITDAALSEIDVPSGSQSIDVYLCDRSNIDLFLQKVDNNGGSYSYMMEGSVENTKQGLIKVDDVKVGTWYLGLKNPSSLEGVNIAVEVVAIVEESIDNGISELEEKAILLGNLGWSQFKNGEYQVSLESFQKSLSYYKLGWVMGNKGLTLLMLGNTREALDVYIDAILLIKSQTNPRNVFQELINDIDKYARPYLGIDEVKYIREILSLELNSLEN